MVSNPAGVQFVTGFIAGTTANVPITYTATCCRPIVDITATDARGNFLTRRIDANYGTSTLYTQTATTYAVCVFILIMVHGQVAQHKIAKEQVEKSTDAQVIIKLTIFKKDLYHFFQMIILGNIKNKFLRKN